MFCTKSIILVSANALTLVYKGFAIGLQVCYGGNLLTTIIIILLLFLPSLLIAMITTVGTNFQVASSCSASCSGSSTNIHLFQLHERWMLWRRTRSQDYVQQEDDNVQYADQWSLLGSSLWTSASMAVSVWVWACPNKFITFGLTAPVYPGRPPLHGVSLHGEVLWMLSHSHLLQRPGDQEDVQDQDEVKMKEIQVQDEEQ